MTGKSIAWFVVAAWMIALLALPGCSKSPKPDGARAQAGKADAPLEQQSLRRVKNQSQITDDEANELAARVEEAVRTGDVAALDAIIDYEALANIATEGIAANEKSRREFTTGMLNGVRGGGGLAGKIVQAASSDQGGSYSFLRVHDSDKSRRLLFRMLLVEGGLNYHDWVIERRADGSLALVDVYMFNLGESLSQTVRRMYTAAIAHENRGFLDRLTGAQQDYIKHMNDLQRMSQLMSTRPAEVLAIYRKLPASLKKDRLVLGIRMTAAQAIDDAEYATAIDDFKAAFPDDASTNLLLIDGYMMQKRFADSLAAVDSLDKLIGGDPYLNVMRGHLHVASGDLAAARTAGAVAVAADPNLVGAYWLLVSVSLADKQPAETLRLLTLLEKEHHLVINDLTANSEYADFVKTDEYQQWLAAHAKTAGEAEEAGEETGDEEIAAEALPVQD